MSKESDLLKEYVTVLVEKIRTKKGVKGKFKVEQFKKLSSYQEMIEYASMYLEELGGGKQMGSSRRAFIFSGSKVIKIAKNNAGIGQNEAETLITKTAPKTDVIDVVTKVHAYDPDFKWIIVDMAKIEDIDQVTVDKFKSFAGVSWQMFHSIIGKDVELDDVKLSPKGRAFTTAVLKIVNGAGLERGDVMKLNHWGVVGGDRIVLIDFGFTVDVKEKEYEKVTKDGKTGWAVKDKEREKEKENERKAMELLNKPNTVSNSSSDATI
jgi:hypothetical protein